MELVPLAFLQQHRRRVDYLQVEHRGFGGLEVKRRGSFYFCEECVNPSSWSQFFEGVSAMYGGLLRIMAGNDVFLHFKLF